MREAAAMLFVALFMSGCADVIGSNKYVLDGKTNRITSADLETIFRLSYGIGKIQHLYRVHVISSDKVELWYRHPYSDHVGCVVYARHKKSPDWKGDAWNIASIGGWGSKTGLDF